VRGADGAVRFQGLVDLGHFTFRSAAAVDTEQQPHQPGAQGAPGWAVQVDPMKPTLKPPGTKRLRLKCDILLSN
jgi:hypothetical protein